MLVMMRMRRADVHDVDIWIGDQFSIAPVRFGLLGSVDDGEEVGGAGGGVARCGCGEDVDYVGLAAGGGRMVDEVLCKTFWRTSQSLCL
jgi:hypothetical protein